MVDAPDRIWASSVTENYGEWQTVTDGMPRPTEYIRADLVTLSDAVAERGAEPVDEASRIGDAVLDWMVKFDLIDGGNEYYAADVVAVLNDLTISDTSPPTSELEAANSRLLERVAELEAANDKIEIENGLTSDGSLWRWWSKKCREVAAKNTKLEARLAEALKSLDWYGEQARLARLIHSEGDKGRHALAADGGKLASRVREGGKVDG